ncbi:hypothetical protein ZWY2020_056054 [Hordeum vulgare]|nr:hypothetical protein ZWY2020_056054 [Hordeum vulgare]
MCLPRRWGSNMADMLRAKTWACTTILLQGALIFGQFSKEIQAFKVVVEHVKRYKTQDMHSNRIVEVETGEDDGNITTCLATTIKYITIVGIMRLSQDNTIQTRASATVISVGVMHDHIDDSVIEYNYIFHMFDAGVADLMEGLRVPLLMDFDHCFRMIRITSLVISTFIFFGILKLLAGCTAINVI